VKLVHLVGFIIKEICYDAQSHKRKMLLLYSGFFGDYIDRVIDGWSLTVTHTQ